MPDYIWIILVILVTAILIAMAVVLFIAMVTLSRSTIKRFKGMQDFLEDLPGCRIDNLEPIKNFVDEKMNIEFQEHFDRLAEDSASMFESVWVPKPHSRLMLPDIMTGAANKSLRKSNGFAVLFGGIAGSALAISTAFIQGTNLLDYANVTTRFLALLPLLVAAIGLLVLNQTGDVMNRRIQHRCHTLMISLERKVPVYSEAAETARLIYQMREYDAHMAKSVASVANQVQILASGKLSDSISSAVKYVMAATVSPAIVKSSESLSLLAQQIEKQLVQTDSKIARLYTELESRQEKQAEIWIKRYQEAAEALAIHQNSIMNNMSESGRHLVEELGKSQKYALEQIVEEQRHTLQQVNNTSQRSWSMLQEKLTSIVTQLAEGQTTLLGDIHQSQSDSYDRLLSAQTESFNTVSATQQKAYEQVAVAQHEGLQAMQAEQAVILQEIDKRQETTLLTINSNQSAALERITATQAESLSQITNQQKEAVQYLAENFGSEVSGKLSSYLDPISVRLHDASEALIASQSYSKDVGEVLRMQNEAATELQSSIGELFGQLVDTRKSMTEDLQSLKVSSGVMSHAAEIMGSVYEGSQTGLSEAISQMSRELIRLSDVLRSVMDGSAEQTRLMQSHSIEAYEINQKHLEAVHGQVDLLSDELANRIDQLMMGFTHLTEDLITNVNTSISSQNDTLGGSLRTLTEVMSEEARSMSLFAQQINMDIGSLNDNFKSAVSEFDVGIRKELTVVLGQFDTEITDIVNGWRRTPPAA